ncbi:MAG: TIGR02172 family protein [Bacteroidales bacterium]|nr:TIGR02172 family protein [Bacteroidales bacterium]
MGTNEYRRIALTEWRQMGEGGNGKTYENLSCPDQMLKVNNERSNDLASVKQEFDVSKAVERLGLPTPRMFEIVRVGDGYATICERIREKKSLSRICHDAPERTEEMGALLAKLGKELSATPCDTEFFPNRREQALRAVGKATFVRRKNRAVLRAFIETIPEDTHCSHGDFQPGNVILSEGKCYWIDLGRFACGDPLFDIGHLYQICNIYAPMKRVQDLFHMSEEQFHRFWDAFAREYTGLEDHKDFDRLAGKYAAVDVVLRTIFLNPSFAERLFFRYQIRKLVKQFF